MLLRKRHQHFLCSPVLAATSPYRGDIFVPQSREGYTKEIIFGHDLGNGIFANTANANDVIESFTYINFSLD